MCVLSFLRLQCYRDTNPYSSYTQKQLYNVVSDVSSYPKFVPFCTGTRILTNPPKQTSDGRQVLEAEMTVGFLAFKESYVSTVTCTPDTTVEVR